MKKNVISVLLLMMISLSSLVAAGQGDAGQAADAESWPAEPMTMICPWRAGGIADLSIRAISEYGEKYFGQPIVPVVRTGAGGAVAITEFMGNKPNDPKLIMASEGLFAITPLTNEVPYSWDKYVPVIGNTYSAFALITRSGGMDSLDDLIREGQGRPLTIAITGDNLLFVAAFCDAAGIKYEAVPYDGAPDQLAAVLAGDVDAGITHPALAKEHVKAGNINALTVFDDKPWQDEVYDIKPVTDFGFDVVFPNHNFFLMPAGTDPAIIEKVHENLAKIYDEPEFKALCDKMGLVIRPSSTEEIQAHIDNARTKAQEYHKLVYNK
jgi:tripartite-type tricarboxylate transporter receptor subunit TctC